MTQFVLLTFLVPPAVRVFPPRPRNITVVVEVVAAVVLIIDAAAVIVVVVIAVAAHAVAVTAVVTPRTADILARRAGG